MDKYFIEFVMVLSEEIHYTILTLAYNMSVHVPTITFLNSSPPHVTFVSFPLCFHI